MATESNVHQSAGGIRTYRGRTLEEILPQIRADLGPDAIILREREGLVGGVGGFFAQRFIEVDARGGDGQTIEAAPSETPRIEPRRGGQTIDIYDDTPEADMRRLPAASMPEPVLAKPRAILPPEPTQIGVRPTPEPLPPEPKPFVPRSLTLDKPTPPASRFETTVFMDRLREASATVTEDEPLAEPALPPKPARKPRSAAKPRPSTKSKNKSSPASAARPKRQPASGWAAEIDSMPVPNLETATARDLVAAIPPEAEALTTRPQPRSRPDRVQPGRPAREQPSRPAREEAARPAREEAARPAREQASRPAREQLSRATREQPVRQPARRPTREAPEPPRNPYEGVRQRPRTIVPELLPEPRQPARATSGSLDLLPVPATRRGTREASR